MGVPFFYFWLLWKKYIYAKKKCLEQLNNSSALNQEDPNGVESIDLSLASLPNPNGVEFDNLYLDLNGILHHVTHGEKDYELRNWSVIRENLFFELDRIFNIIRPRKLIFFAMGPLFLFLLFFLKTNIFFLFLLELQMELRLAQR